MCNEIMNKSFELVYDFGGPNLLIGYDKPEI